jgi:hypothetical protein
MEQMKTIYLDWSDWNQALPQFIRELGREMGKADAWDAMLARITRGEGTAEIIDRVVVFILRCWICKQKGKVGNFLGRGETEEVKGLLDNRHV